MALTATSRRQIGCKRRRARSSNSATAAPTSRRAQARGSARSGHASWRAPSSRARPLGRNIVERGVLAQLQRPDIGDDRPAVARRHAGGVGIHHAIAIGDDVEEMLVVRLRAAGRRGSSSAAACRAATIMPLPSPSRPWHGAQKISNRCRPRASNCARQRRLVASPLRPARDRRARPCRRTGACST